MFAKFDFQQFKTKLENIHYISITLHPQNWRKSELKMVSSFECQSFTLG